jgi:tRNA(adenine34) deaminase
VFTDEYWMNFALREAYRADNENEVPVGAVIVFEQRIIGKGYNLTERLQDPTAHAEIQAITAAAAYLESRRLLNTTLYVTLEPCLMCCGAILLARIPRLVYATSDPKGGAATSLYETLNDDRLNHKTEITSGVLANESAAMLSAFFARLRQQKAERKKHEAQ